MVDMTHNEKIQKKAMDDMLNSVLSGLDSEQLPLLKLIDNAIESGEGVLRAFTENGAVKFEVIEDFIIG